MRDVLASPAQGAPRRLYYNYTRVIRVGAAAGTPEMPSPRQDSLIDRVDGSNTKIGLVRRRDVFADGAGFRTVHVFVRNTSGSLLLQRIGASNKRSASLWGSSVAGYLNAGEEYEQAARRRMKEEIGLSRPLQRVGTLRMIDDGAMKFVGLFETGAESATVHDHGSIEQLRFWDPDVLRTELRENPGAFTQTFRELFAFYEEARGRRNRPL